MTKQETNLGEEENKTGLGPDNRPNKAVSGNKKTKLETWFISTYHENNICFRCEELVNLYVFEQITRLVVRVQAPLTVTFSIVSISSHCFKPFLV